MDSLEWTSFDQSVKTDKACKDMSRLMSLAYILKGPDQRPYYSPIIDLSRMWASDRAPLPVAVYVSGYKQAQARLKPADQSYDFANEIPGYVAKMNQPHHQRHDLPTSLPAPRGTKSCGPPRARCSIGDLRPSLFP